MRQKLTYGLIGLIVWGVVAFVIGRFVLHLHTWQYSAVTGFAAVLGGWSSFNYEESKE